MHVTRFVDAKPYEAKLHHAMSALQLQGGEESATSHVSCGLSHFLPGGGAAFSSSPVERIYVVIRGTLMLITASGEVMLGPLDSCYLPAGEMKSVENRSNDTAMMIVIAAK